MEHLKEASEFVAIISASWAVISGVGAWRREFVGRRRIELAEATLASFFAVRDSIRQIRNPFSRVGEGSSRKKGDNESFEEAEMLDRGYVVVERYQKHESTFIEFMKLKYRFMATFGQETGRIFEDVGGSLNSIFVSARMLSRHYWLRQGRVEMGQEDLKKHLDEMHRHERNFWDYQDDNDDIRQKLAQAEERFVRITEPSFRQYARATKSLWGQFFGFLKNKLATKIKIFGT